MTARRVPFLGAFVWIPDPTEYKPEASTVTVAGVVTVLLLGDKWEARNGEDRAERATADEAIAELERDVIRRAQETIKASKRKPWKNKTANRR